MTKADDFDMFYAATSRRLVRQIFAMTGDLCEAEDAVQEAYIRAWRRWTRIGAYEDPEAWVRVVACRITVNSWQKARNRLTAHRAGHHELPGLSPDLVALVSALRKIPETQRRAIVLHHLAGLSVEEIAHETGAPTGTVKARRPAAAGRSHRSSPSSTTAPAKARPSRQPKSNSTERNTLMPETFSTQLAGLAGYADRNASLAPAAALRGRAARRTRRQRGGAAALLGGGALAIAVSLGVANTGVVVPAHSTASSSPESVQSAGSVQSPGSVRLTADQTTVLAKAHVTTANLAVLKKMHLTPLQIKALGVAYRTARIAGAEGSDKQLTAAQIASVVKVKLTVAQLAALGYANMTVAQIEAIAKADLTAAQLAALGG